MRKKAGFIVLSMVLAGSLMGCSFSLNKDADNSWQKNREDCDRRNGENRCGYRSCRF